MASEGGAKKTIDKHGPSLFNARGRRIICGAGLLTIAHEKGKPVVRQGRKAVIGKFTQWGGDQVCLAAEGDRKNKQRD